jgi:hypothetical protein
MPKADFDFLNGGGSSTAASTLSASTSSSTHKIVLAVVLSLVLSCILFAVSSMNRHVIYTNLNARNLWIQVTLFIIRRRMYKARCRRASWILKSSQWVPDQKQDPESLSSRKPAGSS